MEQNQRNNMFWNIRSGLLFLCEKREHTTLWGLPYVGGNNGINFYILNTNERESKWISWKYMFSRCVLDVCKYIYPIIILIPGWYTVQRQFYDFNWKGNWRKWNYVKYIFGITVLHMYKTEFYARRNRFTLCGCN